MVRVWDPWRRAWVLEETDPVTRDYVRREKERRMVWWKWMAIVWGIVLISALIIGAIGMI